MGDNDDDEAAAAIPSVLGPNYRLIVKKSQPGGIKKRTKLCQSNQLII